MPYRGYLHYFSTIVLHSFKQAIFELRGVLANTAKKTVLLYRKKREKLNRKITRVNDEIRIEIEWNWQRAVRKINWENNGGNSIFMNDMCLLTVCLYICVWSLRMMMYMSWVLFISVKPKSKHTKCLCTHKLNLCTHSRCSTENSTQLIRLTFLSLSHCHYFFIRSLLLLLLLVPFVLSFCIQFFFYCWLGLNLWSNTSILLFEIDGSVLYVVYKLFSVVLFAFLHSFSIFHHRAYQTSKRMHSIQ